ncbi:MAG TPA: hypothetical protein VLJ13_11385 [Brevundimonas sp.]|nr:hypothetical protein [Brevundimonas sp.]
MKRIGIAALFALVAASPATAAPQQDDDWEFQEDASKKLMVASVRYEAGPAILVQCRDGALTAVVVGLTPSETPLELNAARADGRQDVQFWAPAGAAGAFRSETAGRDVRFMRGGGLFSLRAPEGAAGRWRADFDLPTQSANLDRVLAGCGWALTDDRDLMARAGREVSMSDPDARPGRRRSFGSSRSRSGENGQRERRNPGPPAPPPAESQISCIVRELRLTDCRADHPPAVTQRTRDEYMEWLADRRVYAPDAAAAEGKVMFIGSSPLIVVERIELIG